PESEPEPEPQPEPEPEPEPQPEPEPEPEPESEPEPEPEFFALPDSDTNDFTSFLVNNAFNNDDTLTYSLSTNSPLTHVHVGDPIKSNTFFLNGSSDGTGLQFNTTNWGTDGIVLEEIYVFDGTLCVGLHENKIDLEDITYDKSDNSNSKYSAIFNSIYASQADVTIVTSESQTTPANGYSKNNSIKFYVLLNNNNLDLSYVVPGRYLIEVNPVSMSRTTFVAETTSINFGISINNPSLSISSGVTNHGNNDDTGSSINVTWNTQNTFVLALPDTTTSISSSTNNNVSYVTSIVRTRHDTAINEDRLHHDLNGTNPNNEFVMLENIKAKTSSNNVTFTDTDNLFFNARFSYTINAVNVITGDTYSSTSSQIVTPPSVPINVVQDTSVPHFKFTYDNHFANGTADTINYRLVRSSFTISGTNAISVFVQETVRSDTTQVTTKEITTGQDLLYGKPYDLELSAYNSGGQSYNTVTYNDIVMPNLGVNENAVTFTYEAKRIEIGGSTIQDIDSQNVIEKQTYIELTISEHTFNDGTVANEYKVYEKQKLMHTITSPGTYIISRKYGNNSNSLVSYSYDDSVFIDIVAINAGQNKYSNISTTTHITTLSAPPPVVPSPLTNIDISGGQNSMTISFRLFDDYTEKVYVDLLRSEQTASKDVFTSSDYLDVRYGTGIEQLDYLTLPISGTYLGKGGDTITHTITGLGDNLIAAFRFTNFSEEVVRAGEVLYPSVESGRTYNTSDETTTGEIDYGTNQDYTETYSTEPDYIYKNESKTTGPTAA
ncbi:MAG: hypothetical protein HN793_14955, partial [Rhodospirillaceae bacterium]|nr:hypothetical protein [Rhodospirillaceae bacterium]